MIQFESSTPNSITIRIEIKQKLAKRAELVIQVYQRSAKLQTHQLKPPFPEAYKIKRLEHQSIYLLKVRLENGQANSFQNLHAHTAADPNRVLNQAPPKVEYQGHQFALSEKQLIDILDIEDEDISIFESKQEIARIVQQARKNSSAQGFIKSEYKICRPPELKEEHFKRVWMIAKGQQFYDEVYGSKAGGMQFMKNDWFMGPFYSYGPNEKKLREAKAKADLQIQESQI